MSPSLAARLASLTARDEGGVAVTLGAAWVERPAVVAFVRHFG